MNNRSDAQRLSISARPPAHRVRALLSAAGLPVEDLGEDMSNFLGCGPPREPVGVIGLEILGEDALLRSLVVVPSQRGRGCGCALVHAAELRARQAAVRRIYLLTETAEAFFASLGYQVTPRERAPDLIRGTREFSSLCPSSAILMSKTPG